MADRQRSSRVRFPVGLVALLGAAAWLVGCADPLFPENEDRSQFAGYNRARDQTVPPYVNDEFGDRRPNLRGRLLIRD